MVGTPKIKNSQIHALQKKIWTFYSDKGRDLPWRKTADPYAILISEIMLQQTQVDRVVGYWKRWLKKWPTIHDLAKASREDVFREWLGLGYNNRAKYLHQSAKIIAEKYKGDVLAALKQFKELPGIGPYTASAVQIFSANKDLVAVDTNIRRILIHELKLSEKIKDKELLAIAKKCLPKGKSRDWHNALMDYGATLLTSRKSGIRPKARQGKFEGSNREVRAKILRILIHQKSALVGDLKGAAGIGRLRLGKILEKMEKEGIIKHKEESYALVQ